MKVTPASPVSHVEAWRLHCEQHVPRLVPNVKPATLRRIERCEALCIDRLGQEDLPISERAIALRTIVEVRGCTTREAANFFDVEPAIVVLSMSLLELPVAKSYTRHRAA